MAIETITTPILTSEIAITITAFRDEPYRNHIPEPLDKPYTVNLLVNEFREITIS